MTEDTGWNTPASDEAPAANFPDPHVDKDSPAATGVDVDALESQRDEQLAELRNLILSQNEQISALRQQVNGQQVSVSAQARDIPDEDHGGCTQCKFLSLNETPNGEDEKGNPTPLPAAQNGFQHLVFTLGHAAETHHAVYVKFADRVFQITRGLA